MSTERNIVAIGDGQWFDADAAQQWQDDTYFDGQNHLSVATRSQWHREKLYLTKRGQWVAEETGHAQNRYSMLTPERAAAWLIDNGHTSDAARLIPEAFEANEV